jgi:D-alanine-D-alanine ligase
MRVTVLHNSVSPEAAPDEADVLVQAAAIAEALTSLGHQAVVLDCGLDLAALATRLTDSPPDAVFNLVESLAGHGRLIHLAPGLLDALDIPYTGCPAEALFLTSHKPLAKSLLRRAGLPTPDWVTPADTQGEEQGLAERAAALAASDGDPTGARSADRWIVKSVWEDASLGMDDAAVVTGGKAAAHDLLRQRTGMPGAPWFAEEYIEGREFNLSLLDGPAGPQVLPPAEMRFAAYPPGKPRIVGYAAKWDAGSFEYSHTVRSFDFPDGDAPLLDELTRLSHLCWDLFGLRGWARVDFRIDAEGRPWILEVNANPCLAPDAGYVAALERAGISFRGAIESILVAAGTRVLRGNAGSRDPAVPCGRAMGA